MKKSLRKQVGGVHGKGTNDAPYPVIRNTGGVKWACPYYDTWKSMIRRCYSESYHKRVPTYKDCIVCEEWLTFTNFKTWMEEQDWRGKQLDKDLLVSGNKLYSPETCVFLSARANSTLLLNSKRRGSYPVGVSLNPSTKKYQSHGCDIHSKSKNLGSFDNIMHAHRAWQVNKLFILNHVMEAEGSERATVGFKRIMSNIRDDYINNRVTTTF